MLDSSARSQRPIPSTFTLVPPLRLAPALYAATLFASALLLFSIQPMFAKMVLPRLGGSPSVWSVAMVFFQAALLLGYGYAHLLGRLLSPGCAALAHLVVLFAAACSLPIGIAAGFGAPPSSFVGLWLIALFAASIGLPFVALSASAPLIQHWFASSGHPQAGNPYVLYAASNLGSFAALLAYPFLIEPLFPLREQARGWSIGFALLAMLITVAALVVANGVAARRDVDATAEAAPAVPSIPSIPSWPDRLSWMGLASVPSGLVIAVTSFVSTDIAAAPFLWVFPLAIYLATFVAVFRDRPWFDHAGLVRLTPLVVAPVAVTLLGVIKTHWLAAIGFNLLAFSFLTLVCHGELYRRRPTPAHLTEFYLWISLGGVIGGIFAGLLAPYIFNNIYEYPILIAAALLALPGMFADEWLAFVKRTAPILVASLLTVVARFAVGNELPVVLETACRYAPVLLIVLVIFFRKQPAIVFALVVFSFLFTAVWTPGVSRVAMTRSFFGVHQVNDTADGYYRLILHGTTIHGAMRIRDRDGTPLTGRPEPLLYYHRGSPMFEAVTLTRAARGQSGKVAVVGLGAGALACHAVASEQWTFYEIDQKIVDIARDPRLFRFISECAPTASMVLGDARLTLAASHAQYDLIIFDAFSSDSVPVHLLTREAFDVYLSRLAPGGALVVHISNRYVDLAPVVAAAADAAGLVGMIRIDRSGEISENDIRSASTVTVLGRGAADLGDLRGQPGWKPLKLYAGGRAWTDDYSDILGAMIRRAFGR